MGKTVSKGQSRTSEFNTNVAAISKLDDSVKAKLKTDYVLVDSLEEEESRDIELSDYDRELLGVIECVDEVATNEKFIEALCED